MAWAAITEVEKNELLELFRDSQDILIGRLSATLTEDLKREKWEEIFTRCLSHRHSWTEGKDVTQGITFLKKLLPYMMREVKISLNTSTEQKVIEFYQSAELAMDEFYPGWWNDQRSETVCIPACHDVFKKAHHNATDPQAATYDQQFYVVNERFYKGENAENEFLRAFQKLNLGGVLISGFDSAEYATTFKQNLRFKKFGIKALEIDALFIHPSMGIFAIEIKATTKTSDNADIFESPGYKKALDQLHKFKEQIPLIFQRLCDSADSNVHIHLAICFPNALLDNERSNQFIHIDNSCFVDLEKMKNIFSSYINVQPIDEQRLNLLKRFACAIAGYRSIEFQSAGCNALAVHKMIGSQSFGGGEKLDGGYIFWTNEQLEILKCKNQFQMISGPPGTGKTLILLQKALEAAQTVKEGSSVYVIANTEELKRKFQIYFQKFADTIVRPLNFSYSEKGTYEDDVFKDEQPVGVPWDNPYERKRRGIEGSGSYIVVLTGELSPRKIEQLEKCNEHLAEGYRCFSMNTVIRSSEQIFNEWKDRFSNMPIRLGHTFRGPSVKTITALNSNEILENILEIYQTLERQIENFNSSCLVIITQFYEDCEEIKQFLRLKGVACGNVIEQMDNQKLVAVDTHISILSLEWPFVIVVSLRSIDLVRSFLLLASTRCMSQLYIIKRDYMSIQASIDEKFRKFEDLEYESADELSDIVIDSGAEFNETREFVHVFDRYCAQIRHNYMFGSYLYSVEQLEVCDSLFACFEVISSTPDLCRCLLLDKQLYHTAKYIHVETDSPTKLFDSLCSNRDELEKAEQWKILVKLAQALNNYTDCFDVDTVKLLRYFDERQRKRLSALIRILIE